MNRQSLQPVSEDDFMDTHSHHVESLSSLQFYKSYHEDVDPPPRKSKSLNSSKSSLMFIQGLESSLKRNLDKLPRHSSNEHQFTTSQTSFSTPKKLSIKNSMKPSKSFMLSADFKSELKDRVERTSIEINSEKNLTEYDQEQNKKLGNDPNLNRNSTKSNDSFKIEPNEKLKDKIPEKPPRRNKSFVSAKTLKLQTFEDTQATNDDVYFVAEESYIDLRTPFIGKLIKITCDVFKYFLFVVLYQNSFQNFVSLTYTN